MKSIVSPDVSFHTFLLYIIMPLFGNKGREGTWIGNDANLFHAETVQKCPSALIMLEAENDVEFALEIHGKKENWSLSVFVPFCWCGNKIEWFLATTNQFLSFSWWSFLSLFDTLISCLGTCYISTIHSLKHLLSAYLVVHTVLGVTRHKYKYRRRKEIVSVLSKTLVFLYSTTDHWKHFNKLMRNENNISSVI